ncbi:MAG: hypothetical protein AB4290_02195, partial [Spirulina sp.]
RRRKRKKRDRQMFSHSCNFNNGSVENFDGLYQLQVSGFKSGGEFATGLKFWVQLALTEWLGFSSIPKENTRIVLERSLLFSRLSLPSLLLN